MSETDLEQRIEAELKAIRRLVEQQGLRLQPTAVNFEEAARLLSVSAKHVSRMVKRGDLRVSNIGGARRIAMTEIHRVLEHPPVASKPTVQKPQYDAAAASAKLAALRRRR